MATRSCPPRKPSSSDSTASSALVAATRQSASPGGSKRGESAWVYVSDAAHVVDVVLTADGVVTGSDGVVKSSSGPSRSVRHLRAADDHPAVAEAYRILGLQPSPSWAEFYKVYEVLREACGGSDSNLSKRTRVSQRRIEQLTATSNHQLLSGDEARHAAMKGKPSPRHKITKDEGRAIVNDLIEGFAWPEASDRALRDSGDLAEPQACQPATTAGACCQRAIRHGYSRPSTVDCGP